MVLLFAPRFNDAAEKTEALEMKTLTIVSVAVVLSTGCAKFDGAPAQARSLSSQEQVDTEPAGPLVVDENSLQILHVLPNQTTFRNFSMGNEVFQLAHGPAQTWNGCDTRARVMGGYNSDSQCGKGYFRERFINRLC